MRAERIVIAVGTRPGAAGPVAFDDRTIIDSDELLKLEQRMPRTMTVVGAGVIGVEYASMFGALGTKVTVVDQRDRVLEFLDGEIGEAFQYLLRRSNVTFRLREQVEAVEAATAARACGSPPVRSSASETVLYAVGRQGDTEDLAVEKAGLEADRRGRIPVSARPPHRRRAHLRGRRRGRRRARRDRDGAGPDRRAARVRRAGARAARARADRRIRDPGDRRWSGAPRRS